MQGTEQMNAKKITPAQIRMIYGIGKRNDLDDDMLHHIAHVLFHKDSLKELSCWQGSQMIDCLRRRTGEAMEPIPGRASEAQRKYIFSLATKLGMNEPKRLRGFLKARFGVDDVAFLTDQNAGKVIEGLKAMVKRAEKQIERDSNDPRM